jgi:hypothetical protein
MPTFEQNMQACEDLRQRVLDPTMSDPEPEEVWEAVNALHSTRGVKATAKAAGKAKPIIDLADLFKEK